MTVKKVPIMIDKKEFKNNIYIVKALSIFSVICAHCCTISDGSSVWNVFASKLLTSIGTVGIFAFYFLSGYFLCFTRKRTCDFWKQKLFYIVIPWLICGTSVYLYVYLRKDGISLSSWAKWIMGMDTYLYYIVILLVFYLLFYWLRKNKLLIEIFTVLSLVENVLLFVIPQELFVIKYPYLDPLRFGYMFSLGLLVANCGVLPKLLLWCKKYVLLLGSLFIISVVIPAWFKYSYSYFEPWYIPFAVVSFLFLLGLCQYVRAFLKPILINTGRWSYTIYLIHMPLAGIIVHICKSIDNAVITLLRPIIVITIVYLIVYLIKKIKCFKTIELLLGIR